MKPIMRVLKPLLLTLLLCLPGWGKIVDWGKSNFNQGGQLKGYRGQVVPDIHAAHEPGAGGSLQRYYG